MKRQLKRLFFPDFCFKRSRVPQYQDTKSRTGILLSLLSICLGMFNLSAQAFVYVSILICILGCWVMAFIPTHSAQQMEYLKTLPFSPREYALGRLIWSVGYGLLTSFFYVQGFWLMREKTMVMYGLQDPLTFGLILQFALVHFSLVVLSCELTVLIRTRLSSRGFLWILIPLSIMSLAVFFTERGLEFFVCLWINYVSASFGILFFFLSLVLTAVCFLGTVRSLERWEPTGKTLSPTKPLLITTAVLAVAAGCLFLISRNQYKSPVDQALTPEEQYQVAVQCQEDGDLYGAAVSFYACGEYLDAGQRCRELWGQIVSHSTIAATDTQVVALTRDGRVLVTTADQLSDPTAQNTYSLHVDFTADDIPEPHRLVSIHGGDHFIAGLYDDGTVAIFGDLPGERVAGWTDIVALSTYTDYVVGLRADGTAVACGHPYDRAEDDLKDFENLIAVGAGSVHIMGLHPDGTVSPGGSSGNGRSAVWFWKDVVDVDAGNTHTVGLHSNGTVTAIGHNGWEQCNTENWTDVMDIETGCYCTVGLRSDGTVLTAGALGEMGDLDVVGTWTDIVAISVSDAIALGLKADGTLVAAGYTQYIQDLLDQWDNIRLPG